MTTRKPTHPGEVFFEDVIKPLNLTITEVSKRLKVSRKTLSELVHGKCSLSPDLAVKIGKATDTSPESWLKMQIKLDIWNAIQKNSKIEVVHLSKKKTA